MAHLDARFRRDPRIFWRMVEGEAVLVDPDEEDVVRLNAVGSEIWQACDGTRDVRALAHHIATVFEVAPAQAEGDVARFVRHLVQRELLVPGAEGAA